MVKEEWEVIPESGQTKKKKKEKGEETQKSLLIRFPGYDDQECHPS